MFYRPADGHGLPYNPFNAVVTPRPIAWVSTRGDDGDNLAPYSFFNGVAYTPPQVMFASTGAKDTLRNVRASGVFAVNMVEPAALEPMNVTSSAAEGDEFQLAGVAKADCSDIDAPRVQGAPATLECRMTQIVPLLGENWAVVGEVVAVHLRDDLIRDGRYDLTLAQPVARLGYRDYTIVRDFFALSRPDDQVSAK